MKLRVSLTGWLYAALVVLLCACQPAMPIPAPTAPLPTPLDVVRALPIPTDLPTLSPEQPTPTPDLSPQSIARAAHGQRLIDWIEIEAINVHAPVTAVGWLADPADPQAVAWGSPDAQVGWGMGSALPGDGEGNILLFGHNNIHSSVFKNLSQLTPGDAITLTTGEDEFNFSVIEVVILEAGENTDPALYVEYLRDSRTPRLTVISCYPPDNNTHRVIVTALPEW